MKVANTVDLKNKASELVRLVMNGETVIITYRGKPAASLTALSQEDLDDLVLERSPKTRKLVPKAEADRKAPRVMSVEEYLVKQRRR